MTRREAKAVEIVNNRYEVKYPWSDENLLLDHEVEMLLEAMQWQAEECAKEALIVVESFEIDRRSILNAGMEESEEDV